MGLIASGSTFWELPLLVVDEAVEPTFAPDFIIEQAKKHQGKLTLMVPTPKFYISGTKDLSPVFTAIAIKIACDF